ncbi:MAG TPA: hypothetical protein VGK89_09190 [Candidatus Eisenbacteria bacterium]|jgi:hypothetical protein
MPRWLLPPAIALLLVSPALARTGANVPGRALIDPDGTVLCAGTTAPAAARAARPAAAAVDVPLPAGAVELAQTYYDLQDMGSLGTRIVVGADGRVHAAWMDDWCELDTGGCPPNLGAPNPYPQRAMGYAVRATSGAWSVLGKVQDPSIRGCCLSEAFGGFGTISVAPDGRAAISQHMNEDGCDLRGDFYLENSVGGTSWTAYLTPIVSPSFLFPQVVALANGSFVVLGETPRGGCYDETSEFRISRLGAAGAHFVCPTGWQCGPWTQVVSSSLFPDGRAAFPSLAAAANGRVGIAVTDWGGGGSGPSCPPRNSPYGGNVYLIESSDGTFNTGTVTVRKITSYTDPAITASDSTSTQYRPYIHCHLAYNDTTPNVVWSELQARRVSGAVAFFDYRSRIMHWSSTRGISVVRQVQPGEADRYDDVDNGFSGPLAGFNTISVDWPQVGFSVDGGEIEVAWLRFSDAEVDPTADMGLTGIVTGVGFGDVAASVAQGMGAWSAAQNLTQTPSTDERFFSLAARNPDGKAHIVFQASATNQAGVAVVGDRGTSPGNLLRRIAYLERALAASTVAVDPQPAPAHATLRAYPNPARGRVRFAVTDSRGGSLAIYSLDGRLVVRVPLPAGSAAEWDGRDRLGRPVASGVYHARLEGEGIREETRFMLLH